MGSSDEVNIQGSGALNGIVRLKKCRMLATFSMTHFGLLKLLQSLVGGTFHVVSVLKEFSWHVDARLFVPALVE